MHTLTLRPGLFVPGDSPAIFAGYTADHLWNGWACPYFTKDVADQIMALWNDPETPTIHASYDAATDTFTFADDENDFEGVPETFDGADYEVDGHVMHLYAIGNGSWCWDEEEA